MRLTHITAKNFLGLRAVDLQITTPVALLTGPNGAGKSSLRDAIALALTADLGRVSLKKDAGQLVFSGARAAQIDVTDADGDVWGVSITGAGKITTKGAECGPVLPYVLDGQRFAGLDPKARREFLFGLMEIGINREAVAGKLKARGHDDKRIARVLPLLRSGFPAAHDEAKSQATAARGAWKAITGEAYGAQKAETWAAEVPTFDPAELGARAADLAALDNLLAEKNQAIGALDAQQRARAAAHQRLAGLQPTIELLARRREKLARDEAGLAEAQQALERGIAKAGDGPRVGLVHDLARAVKFLSDNYAGNLYEHAGVLAAYEAEHGPVGDSAGGDPTARAALPNLTDARDLMASAVRNSMRDVKAAEDAAAQAKALQEELAQPFDAKALDDGRDALGMLQAKQRATAAAVDRLRALKTATEGAAKRTTDAAAHHVDALAWDALAAALAPDGIPGELLAAALAPINARLAQSAADAEWPRVVISDDMDITAGGRAYRLLSESERWRCDAMLAEAIAYQSGIGLLLLDRFDVLDLRGRDDLLAWLSILAENSEIHTALVFGTLRQQPTSLPDGVTAFWIDGGQLAAANDTTTTAKAA